MWATRRTVVRREHSLAGQLARDGRLRGGVIRVPAMVALIQPSSGPPDAPHLSMAASKKSAGSGIESYQCRRSRHVESDRRAWHSSWSGGATVVGSCNVEIPDATKEGWSKSLPPVVVPRGIGCRVESPATTAGNKLF